jgi:PAS domain S-box-containing protein/putative nucleotidyltransferase with HDIG domain
VNREHILAVLYDLTMVIGAEVKVKPLLTRTLQRLLYHTSFPAGLALFDLPADDGSAELSVSLDAAVGDYELADLVGQRLALPAALLRGPALLADDAPLLASLPCLQHRYGVFLRLPIDGQGVILLLARQAPHTELPLDQIFLPVLANLAKAIMLCRHNEAYTTGLARERDLAREELSESEQRFRLLGVAAPDAIIMIDDHGAIAYWNPAAQRLFGHTADEALGREAHRLIVPARYHEAFERGFEGFRATGTGPLIGHMIEVEGQRRDGSEFPVELSISALEFRGRWHAIGILRDITERRHADLVLKKANRAMKTLSACNSALVHITDEDQLLAEVCRLIVDMGGHEMAWVGYLEHDADKSLRRVAAAGERGGFLAGQRFSWADDGEYAQGPIGRAARSGVLQYAQEIAADPSYLPWREEALRCGFASTIALPLLDAMGQAFGVLAVYSDEAHAFNDEEVALLAELAGDLAFGIRALRTHVARDQLEIAQQHSAERLQRALTGTIQAMAQTVEKRDPYTAGHQQRVAQLVAAMAHELGWAEDRIEGTRLGASIHDIGKIQIPAEILSRPGVLNPMEMALIRTHAAIGYEILRDIEFPWPLVQMILQHHERLDGSGYPQGLKGDAILEEARLLAVADVVESMASHRPYRPALGLDAALAEIQQHRGSLYEPAAVDACLRLFRERGFAFA